MPDEKTTAFLKGLRVDGSVNERGWAIVWGSDGDAVAHVRGAPDDDVCADTAAHALVAAAHEWARWQGVIEALIAAQQAHRAFNATTPFTNERADAFSLALAANKALEAAIDAALKEGSDG